jgi:hypothetical protein
MTTATAVAPVRGGFTLHVGDKSIANPEVLTTWCFDRSLHAEMVRNAPHYEHILLLSIQRETPLGVREKRMVIRDAQQCGTLIRFGAPGVHKVSGMIVRIPKPGEVQYFQILRSNVLARAFDDYHMTFPGDDADEQDYETFCLRAGWSDSAKFVATTSFEITIPEGIHGKPPHPAYKAWVTAYSPRRLEDSCDLNRRSVYAFTVQLLQYPLWEGLKRFMVFLLGVLELYRGRHGEKIIANVFKPELVYTWPTYEIREVKRQGQRNLFKHFPGILLHPIFLSVVILYALSWYGFLTLEKGNILYAITGIVVTVVSGILALFIGLLVVAFIAVLLEQHKKKTNTEEKPAKIKAPKVNAQREREKSEAEKLAQRILAGEEESVALCAPGTDEVARSRQILKQAPISLRLALAKRDMCKPYADAG